MAIKDALTPYLGYLNIGRWEANKVINISGQAKQAWPHNFVKLLSNKDEKPIMPLLTVLFVWRSPRIQPSNQEQHFSVSEGIFPKFENDIRKQLKIYAINLQGTV